VPELGDWDVKKGLVQLTFTIYSVPELGNWDVKKGVTLVSTPDTFPIFTGTKLN
jgi:hypothetical protein